MGCFLSKKDSSSSSSSAVVVSLKGSDPDEKNTQVGAGVGVEVDKKRMVMEKQNLEKEGESLVKEVFVVKHRLSHDRDRPQKFVADGVAACVTVGANGNEAAVEISKNVSAGNNVMIEGMSGAIGGVGVGVGVGVRTSSCTKEEVDAILIQCGRLSRSSSGRAASNSASCERSRKYSGSKRSYDFDHCDNDAVAVDDDKRKGIAVDEDEDGVGVETRHHRHHHRQSRASPQGRRRTPSRERDQQQQRSHSAERSSGRRVSRSPGRRSETPTSAGGNPANASNSVGANSRPGKMVSVPATVTSLVMDKSNNGCAGVSDPATTTGIKRILVKRNVGEPAPVIGPRSASSPRSRSPARINANAKCPSENQQQSLSRSSSRKAEHSPYRRNPLSEIDPNSLAYPQPQGNRTAKNRSKETEGDYVYNQAAMQKPNVEINNRDVSQGTNYRTSSRMLLEEKVVEETKGQAHKASSNITATAAVASGAESLKPQALTRSRSSRRSQDLDLNPETMFNPNNSYNSLLLEDIHSFHQKNTTPFPLPTCVTKACSILEAVADLNSTTSSNLSCSFSEDRKGFATATDHLHKSDYNYSSGPNLGGKKRAESKDPFMESEVTVSDDIMEPSLHKYVTVRRGGMLGGEDMDDQESSGSNSIAASGLQHWGLSSSSWEPNSADSTDCWTSNHHTPMSQRFTSSEPGHGTDNSRRTMTGKTKDSDYQRTGIGRGRITATNKGPQAIPIVATLASS